MTCRLTLAVHLLRRRGDLRLARTAGSFKKIIPGRCDSTSPQYNLW
jgi:hypothetical protein